MSNQKLMANFRRRIVPNKVIRIKRSLPGKAKILVQVRDEIKQEDVIGKSVNSGGFSVVKLAKSLGVSPGDADRYLQKKMGQQLYQGELLAQKKTFIGNKVVIAPTDGVLESYDKRSGNLRLNLLAKETLVAAGVNGIVEAIDYSRNEVTIKTVGTQIFGVMGSGVTRSGVLTFIKGGQLVQERQITQEMTNHIIVADALIYEDAIKLAMSLGVFGIICGGMQLSAFESMVGSLELHHRAGNDVGISLMVTEGFGPIMIGEDILTLIKSYEGRFVFLNGNIAQLLLPATSEDSILISRKTSLPNNLISEIYPEITTQEIEVGAKARVIWPPFMGAYGKVVAIDQSPSVLLSGINTYLVTIETTKRKIKVPYSNIELV